MKKVEIKILPQADLDDAAKIAKEYLNEEDLFLKYYKKYPDLYVGCYINSKLVGICFGYPFSEEQFGEKNKILLKRIAVISKYWRNNYGSNLLKLFEEQAKKRNKYIISLGAAEGYVEKFYLKNGYKPTKLMIRVERDKLPDNYNEFNYDILGQRKEGSQLLFYINTTEYNTGLQKELKEKFNAKEAIFIFEKTI